MTKRSAGRVFRSGTSRASHIRALHAALLELIELVPLEPNVKRVKLRDHVRALERAYPHLRLTDVDVAQMVAEEDNCPVE